MMLEREMRPLSLLIASTLALSGCGTTSSAAFRPTGGDTRIGAYTFTDDNSDKCSLTPPDGQRGEQESALGAVAAPIAVQALQSGLTAIANAFSEAGAEREDPLSFSPSIVRLGHFNGDAGSSDFLYTNKIACIRLVVASVRSTAQSRPNADGGTNAAARSDPSDFGSRERIEGAVLDFLGKDNNFNDDVEEIHYYAEYLVSPMAPVAGQVYYTVRPIVVWYPSPIAGPRHRLASVQLSFSAPGASATDKPWTFVHSFAPDALSPGEFRAVTTHPMPSSGILPTPAVAAAETTELGNLNTLLAEQQSTYSDAATAVAVRRRTIERLECVDSAGDDEEKTAICDEKNALSLQSFQRASDANFGAIFDTITRLNGYVGILTTHASLIETRAPNQFYLAVGQILDSSSKDLEAPLQAYVDGQLGLTDDASTASADGAYLLARFDYDIALRRHEAAVSSGDQSAIETALRKLIEKYNALRSKADSAGEAVAVPPPY